MVMLPRTTAVGRKFDSERNQFGDGGRVAGRRSTVASVGMNVFRAEWGSRVAR
jgi:hypothetical protein